MFIEENNQSPLLGTCFLLLLYVLNKNKAPRTDAVLIENKAPRTDAGCLS